MPKKKETKAASKKGKTELAKPDVIKTLSPFDEMERYFNEVFRRPFSFISPSWSKQIFPEMEDVTPSIDVFEDGDDIVVKTELPGMKKEDIEVNLTEDSITVSGEKKREEKVERKDYYRLERSHGSFHRSCRLPAEVKTAGARAEFKDGVLEVRAPKAEQARTKKKKIAIK